MGSLGGNGSIWGMGPLWNSNNSGKRRRRSNPPGSVEANAGGRFGFPLKQAATAASLALTGDTIAQIRRRWIRNKDTSYSPSKEGLGTLFTEHDWLRTVRATSYGFLFYGPGSYAWYQFLDQFMPKQTLWNVARKVLLNQIILGPSVIALSFAWNNLWLGKLAELPKKYIEDALPTLLFGLQFWIPISVLNFWVVPLEEKVGFMSISAICWNFYLSSTMS